MGLRNESRLTPNRLLGTEREASTLKRVAKDGRSLGRQRRRLVDWRDGKNGEQKSG